MSFRIIEAEQARCFDPQAKWAMLSPFLKQYGNQALSYATLQAGMEYFITDYGYLAYTSVQHPVFARRAKRIGFADPVCAEKDFPRILDDFLSMDQRAAFACVSEPFALALRKRSFKVNCVGHEVELPIQTYNTSGNWKELDLIKRARNEARREGIEIREERIESVERRQLEEVSQKWIGAKPVNDREIWLYARRAVFEPEPDVRKFVAYDREKRVAGFVFYDPIYRDGQVIGYSANISRCDETRFGRLSTAVHMEAIDQFKCESKELFNLCLSPFAKLEGGRFNDDAGTRAFFRLSESYGNEIYNFRGLAFHKSKYRGRDKYLYFGSNSLWPANDVYLAFRSADITRSYFSTLARLLWGMFTAKPSSKAETNGK